MCKIGWPSSSSPASPSSVSKAAACHLHLSLLFLFAFRRAKFALAVVQATRAVPFLIACALFPRSVLRNMVIRILKTRLAVHKATLCSIDLPIRASSILVGCVATVMAFHGLLPWTPTNMVWCRRWWRRWFRRCLESSTSRCRCGYLRGRQTLLPRWLELISQHRRGKEIMLRQWSCRRSC